MTINVIGTRIHIKFEGKDWGVGVARYVNDHIKALPRLDRQWLFEPKIWSLDASFKLQINQWVLEFWDQRNAIKALEPFPANQVNVKDYDVQEFLSQFDAEEN